MIDSYADIQYDEKTRRINRRVKFAFVPLVVIFLALIGYGVSQIDLKAGPIVVNDTQGNIVCIHVTTQTNKADKYDYSLGQRLLAGEEKRVTSSSACSVFTSAGDYQGCLFLPGGVSKDQRIMASQAQTRVKAEACVYPR